MNHRKSLTIHKPVLQSAKLTCTFSMGKENFTNSYDFPGLDNKADLGDPTTEKIANWVAIISSFGLFSVEYFDDLICDFPLSDDDITFFEKLIYLGFGEFRYVNNIPIKTKTLVRSTVKSDCLPLKQKAYNNGPLLLNGGGKDGSVSAWLLESTGTPFTWFQRGESAAQANVTATWNHPVIAVMRNLDPNRKNRKYSGHRPMSAGIAFVALLSAHLYEYSDVIASNETSANEGNSVLEGFTLNHQYSKSLEFEEDIQSLLTKAGINLNYFSLLRPLHEIQIAKIAKNLTDKQLASIISCNNGTKTGYWCLNCAKCAFVALIMTAIGSDVVEKIWGRNGILNTPALHPYLIELLDPTLDKPLECVGTLEECQLAAKMIVDANRQSVDHDTMSILQKYANLTVQDVQLFISDMAQSNIPKRYNDVVDTMTSALSK
ncbi:hypothetical protein HGB25_02690 [Candidatus Saccharibacteria bacterium]|nr:hypothetical protein [Candidatus Saccharibacteria bacterium]